MRRMGSASCSVESFSIPLFRWALHTPFRLFFLLLLFSFGWRQALAGIQLARTWSAIRKLIMCVCTYSRRNNPCAAAAAVYSSDGAAGMVVCWPSQQQWLIQCCCYIVLVRFEPYTAKPLTNTSSFHLFLFLDFLLLLMGYIHDEM